MRGHNTLMFGAVAAALLLVALGVPAGTLVLLAVLAVCPLMMYFMMRGMDHGAGESDDAHAEHHH